MACAGETHSPAASHASNVLNTIATNCFDSHVPMMAAGVISCLVDYVHASAQEIQHKREGKACGRDACPNKGVHALG